jgi:glycosyltransferase involved in cell wall biosynthesis
LEALARQHRIDRVLLMLGDAFLHERYMPSPSCEWVPIYFHPSHLRGSGAVSPDRSLTASTCPFIYVLDDAVRGPLSQAVGKPVFKMPDFFEPTRSGPTARTDLLLGSARNKPIICAIGPITPHKCIGTLLQVAEKRPDWHILIVGTVQSRRHRKEDLRLFERATSMANVTWFRERIDHAELNELTSLSTVHYAAYSGFLHSSNKLIRACENRRPLVVAREGYMAEMVIRHRIGTTCDLAALVSVEEAIHAAIDSDWSMADWEGYAQLNSMARLPEALEPLVAQRVPWQRAE